MGTEALEEAISDCQINFDRRVLVTDLLQEYQISYKEVTETLHKYIEQNERKGTKFEKRFIVSGKDEEDENEIYTIVKGETNLQEWLKKLKDAESSLYSVEVAGSAKPAADIFKPMKWCPDQLENRETRPPLKWADVRNGDSKPKVEPKKTKGFDFGVKKAKPETASSSKSSIGPKEVSPKDKKPPKEVSPKDKKPPKEVSPKDKKPPKEVSPKDKKKPTTPEEQKPSTAKANKKGIASFFGPNTKAEPKKASGVVKPPTPKKMQDFFKKTTPKKEKEANTSVQLFTNEDEEEEGEEATKGEAPSVVDVDTSDDEAQLEELRRQCREKDDEVSPFGGKKRRRIIDSDDEEDEPEGKHDKKEDNEAERKSDNEENSEAGKSETFLDEDGFVITIKSKKPAPTKKIKPATPEKTPPEKESSKKSTKATPKQAAKTKQGNIMNFFTKK